MQELDFESQLPSWYISVSQKLLALQFSRKLCSQIEATVFLTRSNKFVLIMKTETKRSGTAIYFMNWEKFYWKRKNQLLGGTLVLLGKTSLASNYRISAQAKLELIA